MSVNISARIYIFVYKSVSGDVNLYSDCCAGRAE